MTTSVSWPCSSSREGRYGPAGPAGMAPVSREEMRRAERRAIEAFGIPSIVLMENAALAVVREVLDSESFTVVCAPGNNGGDGLAVARHLMVLGRRVEVFLLGDGRRGSSDFLTNLAILGHLLPGSPLLLNGDEDGMQRLARSLRECEVCVDAIFGIGLSRPVEGGFRRAIETINASDVPVVSVDVPSGIDADTGRVLGAAVRARRTITFHRMKHGLTLASEYAGMVTVAPIGIPEPELLQRFRDVPIRPCRRMTGE